jgi:hypothetical protein
MNKFLFPVYRVLVPKPLRTVILKKSLRKKIIEYFGALPQDEINDEQKEVISFLKTSPVQIFPYPFHDKYNPENIEVCHDEDLGMKYVMLDGKRLYFKKRWSVKRIQRAWSDLLREQDAQSPHRYLADGFDMDKDEVLADIGAAEGNFSLSVIEKVKKVYLFEYDREWTEALQATFAPWKDKVVITGKFVSDVNDNSHVRLDTFYEQYKDLTFIKIDVDGAEDIVLESCKGIFASGLPFKIALCTYHKNNDEEKFTSLLREKGFNVTPSRGYMIHYYDKKMKEPYLRRGLVRAVRK